MKLILESILERDIDLLIINKFMTDADFVRCFCAKITDPAPIVLNHISVEKIQHSMIDNDGESDIFVLLNMNNKKIGLFIEDKIDAPAMPDQHERYIRRAEKNLGKEYDEYRIVLVSPEQYDNEEAKKYENRISYEVLKEFVEDDYSITLLDEAIKERKAGYTVVKDEAVTAFRKKYYRFVKDNYPWLSVKEVKGPAGSRAVWIGFNTQRKGAIIQHKSDRGFVDLELSGLGNKSNLLMQTNKALLIKEGLSVVRTGKSASIRANVPIIDFHGSFEDDINKMHIVCNKIDRLLRVLTLIDDNV